MKNRRDNRDIVYTILIASVILAALFLFEFNDLKRQLRESGMPSPSPTVIISPYPVPSPAPTSRDDSQGVSTGNGGSQGVSRGQNPSVFVIHGEKGDPGQPGAPGSSGSILNPPPVCLGATCVIK